MTTTTADVPAAQRGGEPEGGTTSAPDVPVLHVRPSRGWVNDPNGLAHVDGLYHVFFQHNPADPLHDAITWGHASSPDLLHWTDEPLALRPRPGHADAHGCWTGCVVEDDGVPTAVYSGVADASGRSSVVLAHSDRSLRAWVQSDEVATGMPDDGALQHPVTDVRDPFVFTHAGRRYALQGAGRRGGVPQVLLYDAEDLHRWELLGPLLTGEDPVAAEHAAADIWECPNLVRIDGRWVLVLSLWRLAPGGTSSDGAGELSGVTALVGDLLPDGGRGLRFVPATGGGVDAGPAFYAPQLLVEEHRSLMWAWAWELGRTPEQVLEAGWAGVLTSPRELRVEGDALVTAPARELVGLRRAPLEAASPVRERAFEVLGRGAGRLHLVDEAGDQPVLDLPEGAWRLLVDGSLLELFPAEGGGLPATTRAYPTAKSRWELRGTRLGELTAWRLGPPPGS